MAFGYFSNLIPTQMSLNYILVAGMLRCSYSTAKKGENKGCWVALRLDGRVKSGQLIAVE